MVNKYLKNTNFTQSLCTAHFSTVFEDFPRPKNTKFQVFQYLFNAFFKDFQVQYSHACQFSNIVSNFYRSTLCASG